MTESELLRFEAKVEPEPNSGCWLWVAGTNQYGYGQFGIGGRAGRMFAAHRIAYQHWRGPIPEGRQLDHLCRVRSCVNPAHLEPVTCRENLLRGHGLTAREAATTHCPQGHPYSEENTIRRPKGPGFMRYCRQCSNDRRRAAYHLRKGPVRAYRGESH